MANQDIVKYLREGKKRGFSFNLLKQKLVEAGFSAKEVDGAINQLNNTKISNAVTQKKPTSNVKPAVVQKQKTPFVGKKVEHSGTKWMKIAGIVGLVMLVISIVFSIVSFVFQNFISSSSSIFFFSLVIAILSFVLSFFYFFGFVKLGRHSETKLLKIGAWMFIILAALNLIFSIVMRFVLSSSVGGLSNSLIIGLVATFAVLFLLILIAHLLFSIGLIKVGKQVRFAKVAGILDVIVFIFSIVWVVSVVIIINAVVASLSGGSSSLASPEGNLGLLLGLGVAGFVALGSILIIILIKFVAQIFEILALFDASKKFEN